MRVLLTLCYDGRAFCGYQVQPNGRTVQATMQDAIASVYGERLAVVGCSRTDSGVHARDFKMTYDVLLTHPQIPMQAIPAALNRHLPRDISVLSAETVSDTFHVRHHVLQKEYEYLIYHAPVRSPFYEGRAYHVPQPLHISRMNDAALLFLGKHDFAGFMAAGSDMVDTVRTMTSASVVQNASLVRFRIAGNGFLYHMVRIMTGTLLAIGMGNMQPDVIRTIIAKQNRTLAGVTAPPDGLYLNSVILDTEKMKQEQDEGRDSRDNTGA